MQRIAIYTLIMLALLLFFFLIPQILSLQVQLQDLIMLALLDFFFFVPQILWPQVRLLQEGYGSASAHNNNDVPPDDKISKSNASLDSGVMGSNWGEERPEDPRPRTPPVGDGDNVSMVSSGSTALSTATSSHSQLQAEELIDKLKGTCACKLLPGIKKNGTKDSLKLQKMELKIAKNCKKWDLICTKI